MNIILIIIRVISALVFIISGLSKLFPAEVFELTLINAGAASGSTAPYLARLIIGVELFLGIALLQKNFLKRIIVPSSILLLVVFSLHLIYTLVIEGNTGNCGCFGELLPMSPLSALIKNIILIILLAFFYFRYKEETKQRIYVPAIILVISLFAADIISPIQEIQKDNPLAIDSTSTEPQIIKDTIEQQKKKPVTNKPVSKSTPDLLPKTPSVFSDFHYFSDSVYVDLDKGIKIAALLSLDCDHCMAAAKDIVELKKEMKTPPVYFLYLEEQEQLADFFAYTGANRIPYKLINARTFFSLIKDAPPRIVMLNNGNIVSDWDEGSFSRETLRKVIIKK